MTTYTGPNQMAAAALATLEDYVTTYTTNDARLAAAKGDRESALKVWAKTSEDAQAVALRQRIEEAQVALRAMAEENVPNVEVDESDVAKLTAENEALKAQIKAGFRMVPNALKFDNTDAENVMSVLNSLTDPTKGKGGGGGTGHSGPRASVWVTITNDQGLPVAPPKGHGEGEDNDGPRFNSLSFAAKALGVKTDELQAAYAAAAEVEVSKIAEIEQPHEFPFTAKGGQAVFTVFTEPKPRKTAK